MDNAPDTAVADATRRPEVPPEPHLDRENAPQPRGTEPGPDSQPPDNQQPDPSNAHLGYFLLAVTVGLVSYFVITKWTGVDASGGGPNVSVTVVGLDDRTEHYTYTLKAPSSGFGKLKTRVIWFILYVLVMIGAPRIFVAAGQQLGAMIPPDTLLSSAIHNDQVAGALYAAALAFVSVGLNNVILGYLHDNQCHLGDNPRAYLPFRDREDVKVALRAWGRQLHIYSYLVTGMVKIGVRPVMSTSQYVILAVAVVGLCTWSMLRSSCISNAVFKEVGIYMLLACETLWLLGRSKDIFRGDTKASVDLLWHVSVIMAVMWAPV
ncbi:hypothetical protein ACRE_052620 [Hapsidospora chrysogenum ATCC 11550]|uniref:Uncharacterized protein n=1 Tax=Hapsidospora chrysogenum (strain ATCC 11550 / CBS 779.69 / DSM 880 / IAM 14645 / JCM 23072 / IMI 49137) TaxID=857340 RepID=A0A086T3P2_HAPC1|nr:hypothetical protein ACRE_052620 [Hapsidospora chrysogenum ATCC 11550]